MKYISKVFGVIIPFLLALLGFSCDPDIRVEYGSPSATYKAKGVVVSEADNSPIEGIQANLLKRYDSYDNEKAFYREIATTYTNSQGYFFLEGSEHSSGLKLYLELTDGDEETDGSYERMLMEADYSNKTFTGGSGNWYSGEAEINFGTIKMKPE